MSRTSLSSCLLCLGCLVYGAGRAQAQNYGAELFNGLQPASGGMAGVGLARPQDGPSALFGNPATMTQYKGTTFTVGSSWTEATLNVNHNGTVTTPLGGGPWGGGSSAEGALLGAFAVLQDLEALGFPLTFGMGLNPASGAATDFRQIPNAVGTSAQLLALDITSGASVQVTPKLSVGAALVITYGLTELGTAQASGATYDYAAGGTFGISYELPLESTVGAYYRTQMNYTFDNLYRLPNGRFRDINLDRPPVWGVGLANRSLMDGRLLLGLDVMYVQWSEADLWKAIYQDQWALACGAQYSLGRVVLRAGYAWNENPLRPEVGVELNDGLNVGGNLLRYLQATQGPAISQHRITTGFGIKEILPSVDLDMFAGAQLRQSQSLGLGSSASYVAWFAGFGLTWRFGYCPSETCAAPACESCSGRVVR